ncbi:MAG: flagellar hook-associated protein FlgL [Rubrivivax sp.]|jgi:flagellar hook-associated protein 3 FlgL|nr:flagellar hook-associated protein FlgL [Rubrivivax sp.]
MRVTTANRQETSIDTLQRRASEMAESQQRLISGKKIARASDDPTGAARVERSLSREARADASQRALEASRNNMVQAESALGSVTELFQEARELVVQAGNPAYTDAQRRDIGQALRGIRDQIFQIANRGDGNGGWLFGSQGSSAPPFVDAPGGVQYIGAQGLQMAASDEPLPLTADGAAVFLQSPTGNGVFVTEPAAANTGQAWIDAGSVTNPSALTGDPYQIVFTVDATSGATTYDILQNGSPTAVAGAPYVNGQAISIDGMTVTIKGQPASGDSFDLAPASRDLSFFDAMDRMITDLVTPNRNGGQRAQTVATGLRDLDASLNGLASERARLGQVLNQTDAAEGRIADGKLLAQTERSAAEDIDMVQALSDFQQRQTSYDAALRAYASVQKLSLFDYIR